jgi:hypothetical protein
MLAGASIRVRRGCTTLAASSSRRGCDVRRTVSHGRGQGRTSRRSGARTYRPGARPPDHIRPGARSTDGAGHRDRPIGARAGPVDLFRRPRPARRGPGQGGGPRHGAGSLLRLRVRPGHRHPGARRLRLVPAGPQRRSRRHAALRHPRRLPPHLLPAGQGRIARFRRQGWTDGASRAGRSPLCRPGLQLLPRPAAVDHARVDDRHGDPAVCQGLAAGQHRRGTRPRPDRRRHGNAPGPADRPGRRPVAPTAADADADPMLLTERWRAWRESTGWVPRAERYGAGTRSGAAGERRRRRVARRQAAGETSHAGRRRSSRRP